MAAAGSFAAVSTIFGSPVIGAVLIIEATGLGGPVLALVLLPGLLAAGIGSLVFIGLGSWSGFSTSAWQLSPFPLPPFGGPGWGDFGWTIVLAIAAAIAAFAIMGSPARAPPRGHAAVPAHHRGRAGGGSARDRVRQITDLSPKRCCSRARRRSARASTRRRPCRSRPWCSFCLQRARLEHLARELPRRADVPGDLPGGVAGLIASHLPGYDETQAVAVLVGAMCVSILRLPLSSVMIATLLSASAGLAVAPLIIVAVVVAYLTSHRSRPTSTRGSAVLPIRRRTAPQTQPT